MRISVACVLVCLAVFSTLFFLGCSCEDDCECECDCECDCCDCTTPYDGPGGVGPGGDDDSTIVDDDASPADDDSQADDDDNDSGAALPFTLEYIDGGNYSGAALVLNAAGRASIISSRGRRLLRFDEGAEAWSATVLHFGVDANPMAALGPDGALHIVAYDWPEERLLYYTEPDWTPEVIDQDGRVGHYSAVIVDDAGTIHAAYNQEDDLGASIGLRYAYRDGDSWHFETVDAGPDIGAFPAMTQDPTGTPYVTYNTDEDIALARRTAQGWETQILPESKPRGRASGLGFDADGALHVVYHNEASPDGLHYATGSFDDLTAAAIPDAAGVGDTLAMAVDADGATHFVYFSSGTGSQYGHNAMGDWQLENLGSAEAVYLAANSTEDAAASIGGLGAYRKSAGSWQTPVYFGHSYSVVDTAVARDASGEPVFLYLEESTRALHFARQEDGAWVSTVIAADIGEGGYNIGLAVDAAGIPHAVYHYGATGTLNIADAADASGSAWNIGIIDDEGLPGTHCALALDGLDRPHVSYYEEAGGHLKYATREDGAWVTQTVVEEGVTGAWSDIALAADGTPWIAYLDASESTLKLATGGGPWQTETIDAAGGEYVSLAFDEAGKPHSAYVAGAELRHARREDGVWRTETTDEAANTAEMDIAPYGDGVAIAYQSLGEQLRLTVRTSTDRHTQTLDEVGVCGEHVAIAAGEAELFIAEAGLYALWLVTVGEE